MRVACMFVLALLLMVAPRIVFAQSCTASSSGIYFGNVQTPVPTVNTTGSINVSCTGGSGTSAWVCIGIEPSGTVYNRVLMRNGDQWYAATIDYEIYANSARTTVWNTTNRVLVTVPLVSGAGSKSVDMYARMTGGDSPAAGIFRSGLSDDAIEGAVKSTADCNGTTRGSFTGGTFDVSTYILGTCTITADTLNFGSTAGTIATPLNGASALHVRCNDQMPYSIALDKGSVPGSLISDRLLSTGSKTARFQLYRDAARTQVWGDGTAGSTHPGTGSGVTQDIPVYGRIIAPQSLSSGVYSTTIIATVTY